MEFEFELNSDRIGEIMAEEMEKVSLKYEEIYDTEPRCTIRQALRRMRLPPAKQFEMYSAAGNQAARAACKRILRRVIRLLQERIK